jgi:uncharacterized membrane protein YhaH (DUF805 family)
LVRDIIEQPHSRTQSWLRVDLKDERTELFPVRSNIFNFQVVARVPALLVTIFSTAIVVIVIWFLIEVGFLKGTQGPNRFGPDPLS